jgi:uncharacterized protein YbjT (DUF2867 family)
MDDLSTRPGDRVLIVGATGFVGSRLVPELVKKGIRLRLLARDPSKAAKLARPGADIEVVRGDLAANQGIREALRGIRAAYYLVHSMGGQTLFKNTEYAEKDRTAAEHFTAAAGTEGLSRVIYLGGLGEAGDNLSEHLTSRAEIATILSSGTAKTTVLRAAVIIGAGGASYEMLRYLVERLPVMVTPKWITTRIQPIAIRDVVAYLVGCLLSPDTAGREFDIGGPEVFTYEEMMQKYAEARGLMRRLVIKVPVLTPVLSAYWVDLVTPVSSGIAHPLIEGMKNEVVCRDNRIDQYVPLVKTPFLDAVRIAFSEEKEGPGVTGF